MLGKRVWNVDFGFGTVIQNNGQHVLVQFDRIPWMTHEIDVRRLVQAELLPEGWH